MHMATDLPRPMMLAVDRYTNTHLDIRLCEDLTPPTAGGYRENSWSSGLGRMDSIAGEFDALGCFVDSGYLSAYLNVLDCVHN